MTCKTIIQLSIAVILFLTFLAASWYAWQTRRLADEMKDQTKLIIKQTELQLASYIILKYKDDLICKNIGNSSAINVEIDTLEAIGSQSGRLIFNVTFPPLHILEVGEEKNIIPKAEILDRELKEFVEENEEYGIKFFPFLPIESKK